MLDSSSAESMDSQSALTTDIRTLLLYRGAKNLVVMEVETQAQHEAVVSVVDRIEEELNKFMADDKPVAVMLVSPGMSIRVLQLETST